MTAILGIVAWIKANYLVIVAAAWSFDQFLKVVAPLTPWKLDDNLADMIGNLLAKFTKKP